MSQSLSVMSPGLKIPSTSPFMSEMGVKSIKDHNLHLISLFHGKSRWALIFVALGIFEDQQSDEHSTSISMLFLSLGNSILKLQ